VPEQSIVPERSKQYVFVLGENGLVEKREIHTGRRRPGQVEVTAGLAKGEIVVAEGTQRVKDGQPATVVGSLDNAGLP